MSLVLCRLSLDVVIECADKTVAETEELAQRFVREEIDRIKLDSVELITSLSQLSRDWHDSLPYRDPNIGPDLTCRQILEGKS